MKKFIRGLIKIPLTPFAVLVCVLGIVLYYNIMFVQWLYDFSDFDKQITKECIGELYDDLKRWFTTV